MDVVVSIVVCVAVFGHPHYMISLIWSVRSRV